MGRAFDEGGLRRAEGRARSGLCREAPQRRPRMRSASMNGGSRHLRGGSTRDKWSTVFQGSAFLPEGQRLRRRAFFFWGTGLVIVAVYYGVIAPRYP